MQTDKSIQKHKHKTIQELNKIRNKLKKQNIKIIQTIFKVKGGKEK